MDCFQTKIEGLNASQQNQFQEALLKAVDEGLLVLGASVKQAVYYYIERYYNIKREEIPFKPKEFHEALENIFGFGAKVLEKLVVKTFYEILGLTFEEHEDWTLIEYITFAKNLL
jgi:hypothetical protein